MTKLPGKRKTTAEIYQLIRNKITSFEMFPGDRVTEHELADLFEVSRTPVREALKRLEVEGFVSVRPKHGCFIRDFDIVELAEYYDIRIALEQLAVEHACESMPDKLVKQAMEAWDPARHDDDMARGIDLSVKDEAFHIGLAEGAQKPMLADMLRSINNRIRIIRRLDINADNRSLRTYREHFEVLQHILNRDAGKAKLAIKRHILRSRDFAKTLTLTALAQKKAQIRAGNTR
ncbi:GntR family transcriptional regulator [Pseudomethylobacillus aquaticus]|uniref:GntR family transcriptional regulator n=1 Tax=Pseudomethylobacillus aquaticus TaxID=2676064 RepID=A0A3N0V5N3_9PROT|nr:GntR family transcriptional regulator [Pseudomethylobacillus aquaticus]ROH88069.1 GntR family transcriptional regulator [Pseudomethylobacillus aquaticus]